MEPTRAVERVAAMCRAFGVASLSPQVEACRELLRGGGVVDVAVLGQFKAGKSSFLNGLIGGAVVPVDVLPATSVVTRIGYGPGRRRSALPSRSFLPSNPRYPDNLKHDTCP